LKPLVAEVIEIDDRRAVAPGDLLVRQGCLGAIRAFAERCGVRGARKLKIARTMRVLLF
jgi:hypothetical protein